ncbi:MAG: hypothetical protein ACPGO3_00390 [Magnetospiraceae bacterium]
MTQALAATDPDLDRLVRRAAVTAAANRAGIAPVRAHEHLDQGAAAPEPLTEGEQIALNQAARALLAETFSGGA